MITVNDSFVYHFHVIGSTKQRRNPNQQPKKTALMRKIPTVFLRDFDNDPRYVTREPNPDCAWVFAGEGLATRKYDGTCCMFDGTYWLARREVKPGKTPPPNFIPVERDNATGKVVGWEPVEQSAFAKFHAQAMTYQDHTGISGWPVGTYELVGPKVNGNPEGVEQHQLWAHGAAEVLDCPDRTFEGIRAAVLDAAKDRAEGIVFHHSDGRMAKIKVRDFPPEQ